MSLRVDCIVLEQKEEELYLFSLDARSLLDISYVNPQTRDTPEEIQRLLNISRIKKIAEFIKQPSSLIPNNIVLNLSEEVNVIKHSGNSMATLEFPTNNGPYAYILDGQHRLKSFDHTDGINFDLAVVALKEVDKHKAGKIFVDINTNQKPADTSLIFNIREAIGDLPSGEERAAVIVIDLDETESSPLFNKIGRFENDRKKWVKSPSLIKWITPLVDLGGRLQSKNRNDQTQIIINYLKAFKEVFPYAYEEQKEYYLWKPSGIQVMFQLFNNVWERLILRHGSDTSVTNFIEAIEPIKNYAIDGSIPWAKEPYAPYTSGAGRNLLIKKLQNELPPE